MTGLRPLPVLAALLFLVRCGSALAGEPRARGVDLLARVDEYQAYSSCAPYVHHDGREYAVLGTTNGTSIVNVTDPRRPVEVGFIPGPASTIRAMRQYRDWIYIAADVLHSGIQIVRMADPDRPVLVTTYLGATLRAHTLQVDSTRALLYLSHAHDEGTFAGLRILSLADPERPADVAGFPSFTFHDVHLHNHLLFGFAFDRGRISVLDMSALPSPLRRGTWTYPGASPHGGATSRDGDYLYVCDEYGDGSMKVFDLRDLEEPQLVHRAVAHALAASNTVHVRADTAYVAHYTEGVRLYDLADPALPAEWGYYDTFDGVGPDWLGAVEVACFPSGTVAVCDTETGLYLLHPGARYGTVAVDVIDEAGMPIPDADLLAIGEPDSTRTQEAGRARLALEPGSHHLLVRKFPYLRESLPIWVGQGLGQARIVTLRRLAAGTIEGTVRHAQSHAPLTDARIEVWNTPLVAISGGTGAYILDGVPPEDQLVRCERPGYVPRFLTLAPRASETMTADWLLRPAAWYDDCEADRGWTLGAPGDGDSGGWLRAPPVLATTATRMTQPLEDHTPGAGGACYVTGNAGDPAEPVQSADVDGRQTLVSPPLDIGGMSDPTIGYWYWFVALFGEANRDELRIELSSNGHDWALARRVLPGYWDWRRESIRVRQHLPAGDTVWIRFVASDLGAEGVVEAAIDDIELHDAALPDTDAIEASIGVRHAACPAPLNTASRGHLPLVIYASESLDPGELDTATIRLEGIPPLPRRMRLADVGSAAGRTGDPCGCGAGGPDGRRDLLLEFDVNALARVLDPGPRSADRALKLTARTLDGSMVQGEGCVRVKTPPRGSRGGAALSVAVRSPGRLYAIRYDVPVPGAEVAIDLFAVDGRRVTTLARGAHGAGGFETTWDGHDGAGRPAARGVYFIHARIGREVLRSRLVLTR